MFRHLIEELNNEEHDMDNFSPISPHSTQGPMQIFRKLHKLATVFELGWLKRAAAIGLKTKSALPYKTKTKISYSTSVGVHFQEM